MVAVQWFATLLYNPSLALCEKGLAGLPKRFHPKGVPPADCCYNACLYLTQTQSCPAAS
jgi:hypothetical protein